jgi:chaperonin GroEL
VSIEYTKVKSASKLVIPKGPKLSKIVLNTLKTISEIVGATLGPGGSHVLIERYEHDMPPMVTKDGVTVFRSLGFTDAASHVLMEAARDASLRTASEAGDGTTTATILSEAIARFADEFCENNRAVRPQKLVRKLERAYLDVIEPLILGTPYVDENGLHQRRPDGLTIKANLADPEGRKLLHAVAKVSANGDEELADAVLACFDLVGDEGNVTIVESSGSSHYEVEEIDGFPIAMGYEHSCAKFYPMYINDPGRQMCVLEKPVFVLYHGVLHDTMTAYQILSKVGSAFEAGESNIFNVVFVASGFSEQVLAAFGAGMQHATALKIFPLTIPKSPLQNFTAEFLNDLSAITGAKVFDPITPENSLGGGTLEDLGPGVALFEAGRVRSTIIGKAANHGEPWETQLLDRIDIVTQQLANPEGQLDALLLQERLGKLSGGIAKLRVIGSSNGELKEKRDRAEDAVCAVRGAIKHGCLPGGGWTLLRVIRELSLRYPGDLVIDGVLKLALFEPVARLLSNCGMTESETRNTLEPVLRGLADGKTIVYDAMDDRHGDPIEMGILDSTPAVVEAIRNSLSIASQLGTLGGIIAQPRDASFERSEARDTADFIRNANVNEADER